MLLDELVVVEALHRPERRPITDRRRHWPGQVMRRFG
jgi:hypothetical protein